jgi:hypothetical protein
MSSAAVFRRSGAPPAPPPFLSGLSSGVDLSARPYIVPANNIYNGIVVPRVTEGRAWRILNCRSKYVDVQVRASEYSGVPGFAGYICSVAHGALVDFIRVPVDAVAYTMRLATPGDGSTVEIWEDFEARNNNLAGGTDDPVSSSQVIAVSVPLNLGRVVRPTPSSGVGYVWYTDSIWFSGNLPGDEPWATVMCCGRFRFHVETLGAVSDCYAYGSRTARKDGPTALESAEDISAVWARQGATTKVLCSLIGRNDYAYFTGAGSTTPAQLATYLGQIKAALLVSDPGFIWHLFTPIPSIPAQEGDKGVGTLGDFRTAESTLADGVTIFVHDSTTSGLDPVGSPAQYGADGVHLTAPGAAVFVPWVLGQMGIP